MIKVNNYYITADKQNIKLGVFYNKGMEKVDNPKYYQSLPEVSRKLNLPLDLDYYLNAQNKFIEHIVELTKDMNRTAKNPIHLGCKYYLHNGLYNKYILKGYGTKYYTNVRQIALDLIQFQMCETINNLHLKHIDREVLLNLDNISYSFYATDLFKEMK